LLFKNIIPKLRLFLATQGILKTILKATRAGGIYFSYKVRKNLSRNVYKNQLMELEARISEHQGFVDLFHAHMGWNTPGFQRYQQISLQSSQIGGLVIHGGHPTLDDKILVYQEVKKNLYVLNKKDAEITRRIFLALEKLDQPRIVRIESIDLVTTLEEVRELMRKGFKVVYEYIDEISPEISGHIPDFVYHRHKALLKDEQVIVVATSDQLFENVQKHRSENMLLSTNGVDIDHWRIPKKEPPQDLKPALTGRIIVGYHGALAKWVDYDLLQMIADEGSYELLLIGYEHDNQFSKSGIRHHPRVHFLGNKSYFDLNSYSNYYDVAILPFLKNRLTEAVSPIKIFEYMAASKPIVTSDLHECKKYRSCLIAKDGREFILQLATATELGKDPNYLQVLNIEAKQNTWRNKTIEVLKLAGINPST
jgi:glycosyltransferase involved in cell wall biosynthesis